MRCYARQWLNTTCSAEVAERHLVTADQLWLGAGGEYPRGDSQIAVRDVSGGFRWLPGSVGFPVWAEPEPNHSSVTACILILTAPSLAGAAHPPALIDNEGLPGSSWHLRFGAMGASDRMALYYLSRGHQAGWLSATRRDGRCLCDERSSEQSEIMSTAVLRHGSGYGFACRYRRHRSADERSVNLSQQHPGPVSYW